jgi:hypothetical protein
LLGFFFFVEEIGEERKGADKEEFLRKILRVNLEACHCQRCTMDSSRKPTFFDENFLSDFSHPRTSEQRRDGLAERQDHEEWCLNNIGVMRFHSATGISLTV